MDRGVRIVLGFSILLAGIAAAMMFRQPSPRARPRMPDWDDRLVLRQESEPRVAEPTPPRRAAPQIGPPTAAPHLARTPGRATSSLAPMNAGEPPPRLARNYPHSHDETASPTGQSMRPEPRPADRSAEPVRTHQIVDGDTLGDLAERYLGDAGRYLEIYQANRDVLPSPQVLPIGVELKIPSRRKQVPPSPSVMPEQPLVPVVPAPSGRPQPPT